MPKLKSKKLVKPVKIVKARKKRLKDVRIVVLQGGWVLAGIFRRKGKFCYLDNSIVLERWGTTEGIGQLAISGPTEESRLRKNGKEVEYHELSEIFNMKIDDLTKWEGYF